MVEREKQEKMCTIAYVHNEDVGYWNNYKSTTENRKWTKRKVKIQNNGVDWRWVEE